MALSSVKAEGAYNNSVDNHSNMCIEHCTLQNAFWAFILFRFRGIVTKRGHRTFCVFFSLCVYYNNFLPICCRCSRYLRAYLYVYVCARAHARLYSVQPLIIWIFLPGIHLDPLWTADFGVLSPCIIILLSS